MSNWCSVQQVMPLMFAVVEIPEGQTSRSSQLGKKSNRDKMHDKTLKEKWDNITLS